jgi:exopolysaccharide biosynthesis protein
MKYLLIIFGLLNLAIASDFDCVPKQEIKWQKLSEGVEWTKYDLAFTPYLKDNHAWETSASRSVTVRAFKIDITKNKLLFHSPDKELACNPATDRYIHKMIIDDGSEIIGAINASFFVMPSGNILGMALDENKIWSDDLSNQTISSSGVFGIENGVPFLETRDSFITRFGTVISQQNASRFSFAIQAYPKLLINNALQISDSVINSKRSRTSIGMAENQNEIFLVTIDARGETGNTGMTLFEYAHFVKTNKCGLAQKTVLNLDGGGSSSFAIPSLNIFEQADRCRHLGNILTIQRR